MRTSGASRLGQFVKTRKKPRNRTPIENSCQFSLMTNLHKRKCNSKLSGIVFIVEHDIFSASNFARKNRYPGHDRVDSAKIFS